MSNTVRKRRVIRAENKVKKRVRVKGGNKSKLDKRSPYQKAVDAREKYLVKSGSKRKKNIVKNATREPRVAGSVKKKNIVKGARNPIHVKPIDR